MVNATPLVFHLHEMGNSQALDHALEMDPHSNFSAVSEALPHLGHNELRQHEPVIRQVAWRIGSAIDMMRLLGNLEVELAGDQPVSAAAINGLARAYFDKRGTILSITTDMSQRWLIPGTPFTMAAQEAKVISLRSRADAEARQATTA